MTNNYQFLFLCVAACNCFCILSTEAFSTISSTRGTILVRHSILQGQTPNGSFSMPQQQQLYSSSSLNLFPFSRKNHEETKKKGGLERRLSDDSNEENEDKIEKEEVVPKRFKIDAVVQLVSLRMRRVSFLSWWAQVILTTVSAVTLLFTRNVLNLEANPGKAVLLPNYFLAGSSITLSVGSIFWTWASRRLSRRLLRKPTTRVQAANMLRKSITVGTYLNLIGMALAIFGAEQIVGGLAIKVLTTSTSAPAIYQSAQAANLLQPLDILVVQANTNTIFSHFCSVVAYLFLGRSIGQLDPPSVEADERPRD